MRIAERIMARAKVVEKKMARRGGLRRRRRCACREGSVLKKDIPGMKRVWKILGLWWVWISVVDVWVWVRGCLVLVIDG